MITTTLPRAAEYFSSYFHFQRCWI